MTPDQNNGTMRSSKSRSRNKSRNQRTLGNVVNRVFDSSGPEGKVRGTPQQIIEKYLALARDAQLSHDRVAEQSFLQHAEHYTRMLGEAQREQAERQAQYGGHPQGGDDRDDRSGGQGAQQGQNGQSQDGRGDGRDARNDRDNRNDRRDDRGEQRQDRRDDRNRDDRDDRGRGDRTRDDANRDDRNRNRDRDRDTNRDAAPPASAPAATAPDQPGQAVTEVAADVDALPEFLRRPQRGIPEALPVDDAEGPVDTPESRAVGTADPADQPAGEDADQPAAAPRARKPRAATPRRTTTRKRSAAEDAAPGQAEAASDD